MNDKINELYNKLDAQDEIIEQLELENASLKKDKNKAIKFVKENACYDKETKKCNDDLNYNECDELLEILGDKE